MSVLVHSCQQAGDDSDAQDKSRFGRTFVRRKEHLNPKRRYYTTDPKFESFKPLPLKCVCRKYVTDDIAAEFVKQGKALLVYKPKEDEILSEKHVDWEHLIMVTDRVQTPRVDMVTKADMERAYVYGYKDDIETIEAVHVMVLEERAKLIVPFRDDPDAMFDRRGRLLPGRILFPFGPDQRTKGGHS